MNSFWILKSDFDHNTALGIRRNRDNSSVVVNGKKHTILFEQPIVININQNVRRKAQSDVLILFNRGNSIILISEHLRSALSEIDARGYELLPAFVNLGHSAGQIGVGHFQLLINGWGGVAPKVSGVEKVEQMEPGMWRYSDPTDCSKIIDSELYDGSDFFRVWPMPGFTFVTNRIKALFEEMRVKNCRFETLNQCFGLPNHAVPGFGPLPLSLYFRPERAKEVGAKYGIDWFDY